MISTTFWRLIAAKVETRAGVDSASISWDCLKDKFPEVFKVFVDVLESPSFREDDIALAKDQINTAIAHRDRPGCRHRLPRGPKTHLTARIRRTPASPNTRRSRP